VRRYLQKVDFIYKINIHSLRILHYEAKGSRGRKRKAQATSARKIFF